MNILKSIFGGGDDRSPMDSANQYLTQIPGVAHKGYDPYVQSGLDASGRTKSQYEELMSNPQAFIDRIMKGYNTSEGYNFEKDLLTKELSNTAAAGGIAGTPLDQLNQGQAVQGLLSKDMQQYLMNALGLFRTGLEGEEGVATRGYDASKGLTDILGGSLNQQGGLAFNQAQQEQKNKNDLWSMFGKALGTGAGALIGGIPTGGIGALPGAAAGSKIGSRIFGS